MSEFKIGDIIRFKEGVLLTRDGTRTNSNNCFYTTGTMKVIDLLSKKHVRVQYLAGEHCHNYACRDEVELYPSELKYDPEQMLAEEDDL